MHLKKTDPLSFLTIIIALVTLNVVIFSIIVVTAPDELRVQYIPDDAFYYLILSRNFSSLGSWTFDSGVSITSGFHVLFAYLLAAIYSLLNPSASGFLTYGVILSLLLSLASVIVLWFWGAKNKNLLYLMFLALVISSENFVYNTLSTTEWSLAVFIASFYCVWFFTQYANPTIHFTGFLILFILGLFGSVARSDFGLLPLSLVVAAVILFSTTPKRKLLFALAGLMGSGTGVLATFVHSYVFTGEILQSSARMKAYWAQFETPDFKTTFILMGMLVSVAGLVLFALLISVTIFPKFFRKRSAISRSKGRTSGVDPEQPALLTEPKNRFPDTNHHTLMFIAAGICIVGYVLFYSRNAVVQPWYTENLILPILMLFFALADYLAMALQGKAKLWLGMLFLLALSLNIASLYPISPSHAPWPYQKFSLYAGVYLAENPCDCKVGSWNAGIISYYEGGHIVNLDGLVNNDIYPYAIRNDLPAYLSSRGICYIIDYEYMLASPVLRARGGYDDAGFISDLTPEKVFHEGEYGWSSYLTLYRLSQVEGETGP